MIRLGKNPTNLEAISLMTEILLTHILILSYQEKFMSFKSTKQNLGPSNLIDTAHEKTGKWHFIWNVWSCYRYIYPEDFLCL